VPSGPAAGRGAAASDERDETDRAARAYCHQKSTWRRGTMLRTIFMIGLFSILGLMALSLVFGILGGLIGLLFALLGFAIKIAIVGAVVYFVIRIVSPETARRLRSKFSGSEL
jgi:hypothetical protein